MSDIDKLAIARDEVVQARSDFQATWDELKQKLRPAAMAEDARDRMKASGAEILEKSQDFMRNRPASSLGILALILLFFARKPVYRLFRTRVVPKIRKWRRAYARKAH
jgi:ElaB/YqjD/DUF883 family membrane-anchored ribosome-binding protein